MAACFTPTCDAHSLTASGIQDTRHASSDITQADGLAAGFTRIGTAHSLTASGIQDMPHASSDIT